MITDVQELHAVGQNLSQDSSSTASSNDISDIRKAHWHSVDAHVKSWLAERQELLVLLCAVRGLQEYTPENTPVSVKVSALCQVLIDYISAGHFEIYSDLIQEAEYFNDASAELLERTIPLISISTEEAMEFNDLYGDGEAEKEDYGELLTIKLSTLAEKLEERFELEDLLIEEVHYQHGEKIA